MGNCINNVLSPAKHHNKKAYYIALLEVHNKDEFNNYLIDFQAVADKFEGKPVSLSTDLVDTIDSFTDDAEGFHRCFLMEFPSLVKAQAWYKSTEYQAIISKRQNSSAGPVVIASGDAINIHDDKVIVAAFVKAPPVPDEEGPLLGPSLNHFKGRLLLNCALKPEHSLREQAIEFEEKPDEDYDFCVLIAFPSMEQMQAWRTSDAFPRLNGPLVGLPVE